MEQKSEYNDFQAEMKDYDLLSERTSVLLCEVSQHLDALNAYIAVHNTVKASNANKRLIMTLARLGSLQAEHISQHERKRLSH